MTIVLFTSCDNFIWDDQDSDDQNTVDQTVAYIGTWSQIKTNDDNTTEHTNIVFTETTYIMTMKDYDSSNTETDSDTYEGTLTRNENYLTLVELGGSFDYFVNNNNLILSDETSETAFFLKKEGTDNVWDNGDLSFEGTWIWVDQSSDPLTGFIFTDNVFVGYQDGAIDSEGTITIDGINVTFIYTKELNFNTNLLEDSTREFTLPCLLFRDKLIMFSYFDTLWWVKDN